MAKKQLDQERLKIKNIIANNPYLVKNYVTLEGDDINNSLIPKKLLYEQLKVINDDDEFVEDYLRRVSKDQAYKLAKKVEKSSFKNKFQDKLVTMAKI